MEGRKSSRIKKRLQVKSNIERLHAYSKEYIRPPTQRKKSNGENFHNYASRSKRALSKKFNIRDTEDKKSNIIEEFIEEQLESTNHGLTTSNGDEHSSNPQLGSESYIREVMDLKLDQVQNLIENDSINKDKSLQSRSLDIQSENVIKAESAAVPEDVEPDLSREDGFIDDDVDLTKHRQDDVDNEDKEEQLDHSYNACLSQSDKDNEHSYNASANNATPHSFSKDDAKRWTTEEEAYLVNLVSANADYQRNNCFWKACKTKINSKFHKSRTAKACRTRYLVLQAKYSIPQYKMQPSLTPQPGSNNNSGNLSPHSSCETSSSQNHIILLQDIPQVGLAPQNQSTATIPGNASEAGSISTHISMEESHSLMSAVLSLSTAQIAQECLLNASLRAAILQRLKAEEPRVFSKSHF